MPHSWLAIENLGKWLKWGIVLSLIYIEVCDSSVLQKDEREKVERENKMFLSEELDKMKLEIEQEKAELKVSKELEDLECFN